MLSHIATIQFTELDSGDEGTAIIKADQGRVGITLTLKEDGDLFTLMRTEDCRRFLHALQQAIAASGRSSA